MGIRYKSEFEFMDKFNSNEYVLRYMLEARSNGVCLNEHCKRPIAKYKMHRERRALFCPSCFTTTYPQAGVFDHCKIEPVIMFRLLNAWLSPPSGYNCMQARKDFGLTYVSLFNFFMDVRKFLKPCLPQRFTDAVLEIDESYLPTGNKGLDRHYPFPPGRNNWKNQPTLGIVERGGGCRLIPMMDTSAASITPVILNLVDPSCQIFTDSWDGYNDLKSLNYKHETINHSGFRNKWVNGSASTNTAEGLFSFLTRMFYTYRNISPQHYAAYCDEASFRYTYRNSPDYGFEVFFKNLPQLPTKK